MAVFVALRVRQSSPPSGGSRIRPSTPCSQWSLSFACVSEGATHANVAPRRSLRLHIPDRLSALSRVIPGRAHKKCYEGPLFLADLMSKFGCPCLVWRLLAPAAACPTQLIVWKEQTCGLALEVKRPLLTSGCSRALRDHFLPNVLAHLALLVADSEPPAAREERRQQVGCASSERRAVCFDPIAATDGAYAPSGGSARASSEHTRWRSGVNCQLASRQVCSAQATRALGSLVGRSGMAAFISSAAHCRAPVRV